MAENSWISLNGNPEFGGQGLPNALTGLVNELFIAANMAFMTFPGLSISNARVIEHHGTDEDKALFRGKTEHRRLDRDHVSDRTRCRL